MTAKWDVVDTGDPDDFVDRLRVGGGWIYRTMLFDPDVTHGSETQSVVTAVALGLRARHGGDAMTPALHFFTTLYAGQSGVLELRTKPRTNPTATAGLDTREVHARLRAAAQW